MLRRLQKLFAEPAFREAPATVLARALRWAIYVPLGHSPAFSLVPGGARLKVPADFRYTSVSAFLLRDKVEPELRYIQKFVRKGDIFIDVGANIGLFTLKMAPTAGWIVAVEPGQAAGDLLAANRALNCFSNIAIVRKALSDTMGTAALHHNPLGDDPQAFSLIDDGSGAESEQVPLTTLDLLVAEQQVERVDCIKIDVEGAEGLVIGGGLETLRTWHPTVIFEMNCPTLFKAGGDPAAAWNTLASLGYAFFRLNDDGSLRALSSRPNEFCNIVAGHPQGRPLP
ncbi:FkbM family methyltransferase [Azorhizobium doebereinerae]|uniref:FkbM family methyltransferase n=1 Tax=Azorhizobium doebereinerae TaxID=281091 RepID=UPI00042A0478|nr:FkbM family methyltransferase [Azorhizobium doebereinerae]